MAARIDDLERELSKTRKDLERLRAAHARAMSVLRMIAEQRQVSARLDRLRETEPPDTGEVPGPWTGRSKEAKTGSA